MLGRLIGSRLPVIRVARTSDGMSLSQLHGEGFERAWGSQDFEALIAERNVIGHLACRRWASPSGFVLSRLAADEAEILSIVTAARERGRGIARRLLAHHMSALAQERARRLYLEVEAGNEAAITLYRGFGFAETGRRRSYYRKPDGTAADALTMARDL
jgi:[ribosomal protein S18]-alanine N-acetyltransferase